MFGFWDFSFGVAALLAWIIVEQLRSSSAINRNPRFRSDERDDVEGSP